MTPKEREVDKRQEVCELMVELFHLEENKTDESLRYNLFRQRITEIGDRGLGVTLKL